jgi:hypothetical protein
MIMSRLEGLICTWRVLHHVDAFHKIDPALFARLLNSCFVLVTLIAALPPLAVSTVHFNCRIFDWAMQVDAAFGCCQTYTLQLYWSAYMEQTSRIAEQILSLLQVLDVF